MKGLNLSGWSKISEDKNSTTLKHEKQGHKMIIAHDKLPRIQKEALKRLKLAEGGEVYKSEEKPQAPVVVNVGQPAISQPVQSAQPVPVPVPQVPKTPNALLPNGSMNAPAAAQTAQQGAQLGAQVQAAKSAAAVPQEQQYLDQTAKYNQDFANNLNDVKQKADDFSGYLKQNPLKENAYLENMGAGQKMKTALGLLFSGAGSGVTGQPNMAYDFLNKQIDRNIQAQKDRFGQHQTVWGAYKDLYQNEVVANNMARVHALDMLEHQGRLTAAQLGTPSAAAALMDLTSKIAPERNKLIMESAGNLSAIPNNPSKGSNTQPPMEVAPEPEEKSNKGVENIDYKILKPGAEDSIANTIRYNPTIPEADKQKMMSQMTQAQQAEKSLKGLQGTFERLVAGTRSGGISGRIHRTLSPHSLAAAGAGVGAAIGGPPGAGIGAALGEGIGQGANLLTNTDINRRFDADKTALTSYLSSAVPGRGSELIQDLVNKNTPEAGDEIPTLKRKLHNIREFIINHTETDALKRHGLSYR